MTDLEYGLATDTGRVRQVNQDRYFGDGSLFAVADGMGGHIGGEVAAGLAIGALEERGEIVTLEDLVTLVHEANARIVETARDDPALRGMGTTICVLASIEVDDETRLGVANVGDSRVYRLDGTSFEQLTEDHSLVEALVRDGRLTREEADQHPQRNILTRALGIDASVLVDAWELRAVSGDRYLICSDGLFNEVGEEEIAAVIAEGNDPQAAADRLVDRACEAGGRDNVTAVVVHVLRAADPRADDRVVSVRRAVPADFGQLLDIESGLDEPDQPEDESEAVSGREDEAQARSRRFSWPLALAVSGVIIVLVLVIGAVAAYARSAYYVGVARDEVVIYQGRPGGLLWFDPTIEEPVNLSVAELESSDFDAVLAGVSFDGIREAREFGRQLAVRSRVGGS